MYHHRPVAVAGLLERWQVGLGASRAERRIALRMGRTAVPAADPAGAVSSLPSVRRALGEDAGPPTPGSVRRGPAVEDPAAGDDDEFDPGDFYDGVWEDV